MRATWVYHKERKKERKSKKSDDNEKRSCKELYISCIVLKEQLITIARAVNDLSKRLKPLQHTSTFFSVLKLKCICQQKALEKILVEKLKLILAYSASDYK